MDCPPTPRAAPNLGPRMSGTPRRGSWRPEGARPSEPTWALNRMEQLQGLWLWRRREAPAPALPGHHDTGRPAGNARLGPRGQPSNAPTEGILHLAAGGLSQVCFRIEESPSPETSRASPPQCRCVCGPVALPPWSPCPRHPLQRGLLPCWSPHLISVPPPHRVCSGGRPGGWHSVRGEASRGKARRREGWVGKGHLL